jgi:hypothetical protein
MAASCQGLLTQGLRRNYGEHKFPGLAAKLDAKTRLNRFYHPKRGDDFRSVIGWGFILRTF